MCFVVLFPDVPEYMVLELQLEILYPCRLLHVHTQQFLYVLKYRIFRDLIAILPAKAFFQSTEYQTEGTFLPNHAQTFKHT